MSQAMRTHFDIGLLMKTMLQNVNRDSRVFNGVGFNHFNPWRHFYFPWNTINIWYAVFFTLCHSLWIQAVNLTQDCPQSNIILCRHEINLFKSLWEITQFRVCTNHIRLALKMSHLHSACQPNNKACLAFLMAMITEDTELYMFWHSS